MVALTEETPIDLERGRLVIPSNVDAQTFIPTGGKVEKTREPVAESLHATTKTATIGADFVTYAATLTPGSKIQGSRATIVRVSHESPPLGGAVSIHPLRTL
jgi:hypothetical protein